MNKHAMNYTFTVTMKGRGFSEQAAYVDAVLEFNKNPMAAKYSAETERELEIKEAVYKEYGYQAEIDSKESNENGNFLHIYNSFNDMFYTIQIIDYEDGSFSLKELK